MEDILASIRKIISEEPAQSAHPKPVDRPAPVAGSLSPSTAARQPETPNPSAEPPAPRLEDPFDVADPFAAAAPPRNDAMSSGPQLQPAAKPPPASENKMLFGRLAEALRTGTEPASSATTPSPAKVAPLPHPAPLALDDLDDLLADKSEPPREDVDRAENNLPTDFAAIVPDRGERDNSPHKSARAEAFDKMLEARTGKPAPQQREEPSSTAATVEPIIDVEDEVAADARASGGDTGGAIADAAIALHNADGSADDLETDIVDPEGAEAAKSAFGALAAGLAASAAASVAAPRAEKVSGEAPAATGGKVDIKKPAPDQAVASPAHEDAVGRKADSATGSSVGTAVRAPNVVAASLPIAIPRHEPAETAKPSAAEADFAASSSKPAPAQSPAPEAADPATAAPSAVAPQAPADPAARPQAQPQAAGLPQVAAATGLASQVAGQGGTAVGVRTVEDIVAELLRPMLREWLAENMPGMVEKALRIELADGLKTINQPAAGTPDKKPKSD